MSTAITIAQPKTIPQLTKLIGESVLGAFGHATEELKKKLLGYEANPNQELRKAGEAMAADQREVDFELVKSIQLAKIFPPNVVVDIETDSSLTNLPFKSFNARCFEDSIQPNSGPLTEAYYNLLVSQAGFKELEEADIKQSGLYSQGHDSGCHDINGFGYCYPAFETAVSLSKFALKGHDDYIAGIVKSLAEREIVLNDAAAYMILNAFVVTKKRYVEEIARDSSRHDNAITKATEKIADEMTVLLQNLAYLKDTSVIKS